MTLFETLICMCDRRIRNLRSVDHRFDETQWIWRDQVFGQMKMSQARIQQLVEAGWCKTVQLDAHQEYLSLTEEGRKLVKDYFEKETQS